MVGLFFLFDPGSNQPGNNGGGKTNTELGHFELWMRQNTTRKVCFVLLPYRNVILFDNVSVSGVTIILTHTHTHTSQLFGTTLGFKFSARHSC